MQNDNFRGRHEIKLLIGRAEYLALRSRVGAVLHADSHADETGYFIRSVYLDDVSERAYYEKLAGIDERKKYRVRCYNLDEGFIKLECKEKRGQLVCKTSVQLSDVEARGMINGDFSFLKEREEPLCREVGGVHYSRGLKSAVVVDYRREAFVYPVSAVRITFDRDISAGFVGEDFTITDSSLLTVPVFMNGEVVLEIKYNDYLPEMVRAILPRHGAAPVSVSKYCMCMEMKKNIY